MEELIIGDLVAKAPIIQGGMAVGISVSGLASAVANAGGIGVIATAGIGHLDMNPHTNYTQVNNAALIVEIRKAKEKSKGIIGVNIMVALSNYAEQVSVAIEEGTDIIFLRRRFTPESSRLFTRREEDQINTHCFVGQSSGYYSKAVD